MLPVIKEYLMKKQLLSTLVTASCLLLANAAFGQAPVEHKGAAHNKLSEHAVDGHEMTARDMESVGRAVGAIAATGHSKFVGYFTRNVGGKFEIEGSYGSNTPTHMISGRDLTPGDIKDMIAEVTKDSKNKGLNDLNAKKRDQIGRLYIGINPRNPQERTFFNVLAMQVVYAKDLHVSNLVDAKTETGEPDKLNSVQKDHLLDLEARIALELKAAHNADDANIYEVVSERVVREDSQGLDKDMLKKKLDCARGRAGAKPSGMSVGAGA
jgi:hypothetical protein